MSHPSSPDPAAVDRGSLALVAELQPGVNELHPSARAALLALLRALDSAEHAMSEPTDIEPYAHAAGVLVSLLDTYRRELAALGTDR